MILRLFHLYLHAVALGRVCTFFRGEFLCMEGLRCRYDIQSLCEVAVASIFPLAEL